MSVWLPAVAGQQAQPSAADRFASQQATLAALEGHAGVYQVVIDYSYTLANGEQNGKKTKYLVTRKPGHIRIQADDGRMVFCSNPTYMFVAAKPKPGSYLLAQYRAGTEYGSESVRENEFNRFVRNYHFVAYPLTECIESDYRQATANGRLRPTAIERAESGTRVRYTRARPGNDGRQAGTITGTMTFDDAGRLTRLSEQTAGGAGWKMEKTRSHTASLSDGTRFTSTEAIDVLVDGVTTATRCVVTPVPDPPADDYEFYLSHYGLPEPIGGVVVPTGPVPLWWWFAGAALLAMLAVACRRLARSRASPGVASPPTGA